MTHANDILPVLAEIAYDAFYDGRGISVAFDDLYESERQAWIAAVTAVFRQLHRDKE